VTIAIAPAVAEAEQRRALRRPPDSLDAWGAYSRCLWHSGKFTANDNEIAQHLFQRAIELDPHFAGGYSALAWAQLGAAGMFHRRDLIETFSSAVTLARQALSLDGTSAEARTYLGLAVQMSGDTEGGLSEIDRALAESPNLASAHGARSIALNWSGRPKEALAAAQRCIRLNPHDPMVAIYWVQVAVAHYFCREYEQAVAAAKRVIRGVP